MYPALVMNGEIIATGDPYTLGRLSGYLIRAKNYDDEKLSFGETILDTCDHNEYSFLCNTMYPRNVYALAKQDIAKAFSNDILHYSWNYVDGSTSDKEFVESLVCEACDVLKMPRQLIVDMLVPYSE